MRQYNLTPQEIEEPVRPPFQPLSLYLFQDGNRIANDSAGPSIARLKHSLYARVGELYFFLYEDWHKTMHGKLAFDNSASFGVSAYTYGEFDEQYQTSVQFRPSFKMRFKPDWQVTEVLVDADAATVAGVSLLYGLGTPNTRVQWWIHAYHSDYDVLMLASGRLTARLEQVSLLSRKRTQELLASATLVK